MRGVIDVRYRGVRGRRGYRSMGRHGACLSGLLPVAQLRRGSGTWAIYVNCLRRRRRCRTSANTILDCGSNAEVVACYDVCSHARGQWGVDIEAQPNWDCPNRVGVVDLLLQKLRCLGSGLSSRNETGSRIAKPRVLSIERVLWSALRPRRAVTATSFRFQWLSFTSSTPTNMIAMPQCRLRPKCLALIAPLLPLGLWTFLVHLLPSAVTSPHQGALQQPSHASWWHRNLGPAEHTKTA